MYFLFRDSPARRLGQALDPNIVYIRRTYKTLIDDVKNYYRRAPKHVASNNLFALLIQNFRIDFTLDDAQFAKRIDEQADGVIRNFNLTSPIHRGKIFDKGVTLGPNCEEIVISSYTNFPKDNLKQRWIDLKPIRYLYHTRTDCILPIMNNTTPGKGYGVIVVDIPMLMVQYRYWLKWQKSIFKDQQENAYRFVGSILLPNLIESYLDIAYFNRMDRQSQDIRNLTFKLPHPFYLTDLTPRLDKLAERVNNEARLKGIEMEGLAWITPMVVKENLFQVMELPRDPVTFQNEWALTLARLPYVRYLTRMLRMNPGFDRAQLNEVMIDLIESSRDQAFSVMGNSEFIKTFRKQVDEVIAEARRT